MNTYPSEPAANVPDEIKSRKERRMERRQETQDSLSRQALRRKVRRIMLWTGVAAALVLAGWGVMHLAQQAPETGPSGVLVVPVGADEHMKGSPDAPITLVEYSDFQCPACASFASVVSELLEEADGQLKVVYRHFPLKQSHPNAQVAAQAAEAAALQGAFWEMHDKLFDGQRTWSDQSSKGAKETFEQYAVELGLDAERFTEDSDSGVVKDAVDDDYSSGTQARINSTPSFFVNGTQISGFNSLDDFRSAVLGSQHAN